MAQKVATACKMKSRQETTSLGQIATATAQPTIRDKHFYFINTDTRRFRIQTGDIGPSPWQGLTHGQKTFHPIPFQNKLQSQTKLLEKVFPIMSTFLRNKTISKTMPLRKEIPFPQFNVASYKCPGIRAAFF